MGDVSHLNGTWCGGLEKAVAFIQWFKSFSSCLKLGSFGKIMFFWGAFLISGLLVRCFGEIGP
jgi:hypothetical protein